MRTRPRWFFPGLFALLLASRLCHLDILWAEETLPLAAARQMLDGKTLYRDIWFDKPPLWPVVYLPIGASTGWPLRLGGALYVLLACWIAFRFARDLWSPAEGFWAAGLLGFFLVFDFPSAVIPVASDLLMLAPHLAAVWLSWKRRPFLSGVVAGLALAISPKGFFVLVACVLWNPSGSLLLGAGFAAATAATVGAMWAGGVLPGYWQEVWKWGVLYARAPLTEQPLSTGLTRTAGWAGFHLALIAAACWFLRREYSQRLQWAAWCLLSFLGVAAGLRFFPRYYFLLLAPAVLMAARGFQIMGRQAAIVVALLLLVPMVRFGPRYVWLAAGNTTWTDTLMDQDSRRTAALTRTLAHPGDTLFVWGYRPELYVYTGLPAATRFLDCQPLTSVPADRHLTDSTALETEGARARRAELTRSSPNFVIDGLGLYNPQLAITRYTDLADWFTHYHEAARTNQTVIYARNAP